MAGSDEITEPTRKIVTFGNGEMTYITAAKPTGADRQAGTVLAQRIVFVDGLTLAIPEGIRWTK
jgi:hypothetical protein